MEKPGLFARPGVPKHVCVLGVGLGAPKVFFHGLLGARYRLQALALVLVWGTTPVLAVLHAHSSAEVHRYCAEHGTLEDVVADRGQAPMPEGDGATVLESETGQPHGGCAFGRFCRFGEHLSRFVLETAGALAATPVRVPVVRVAPASIAVIVVAPKTSPPV